MSLSSDVCWALLNQSMPPLPSFIILVTFLFTNAMDKVYRRWPRWPSGCRRIVCWCSFLFCSLSCISGIAAHIATCKALRKTLFSQGMYHSASNSRIFSVNFCVSDVRTILQQCGANRILSVNFRVRDVRTIQQQCGANRILSVYFCERDVHTHSATVWGKSFLFSKFSRTWRTYHSWLYWGSLRLTPMTKFWIIVI